MVSRVYTPLITPYNRPQVAGQTGANKGPVSSPLDDPKPEQRPSFGQPTRELAPPSSPTHAEPNDTRRPSTGLQAVQTDRFQKIPLDAVLHDFQNTMNALGTDEQTRGEVSAYLRVVSLQGTKDEPQVPFIKQTLRTAAGTLDQYISKALGQPSHVVKEWVDALLMQDIDYHTSQPFTDEDALEGKAASSNANNSTTGQAKAPAKDAPDQQAVASNAPAADSPEVAGNLSVGDKSRLKSLIEQAKSAQQAGQSDAAQNQLQEALNLLNGKEQPDMEGKVWQLRGRFYDKSGDWQQAVSAYEQASSGFSVANRAEKQAQSLQAAASILEEHGRMSQALDYYRQVVTLDEQTAGHTGDRTLLARSLNDLGSAYLRAGDGGNAVAALEMAAREAKSAQASPQAASDIFSNLGAAYRSQKDFTQAEQAYRHSMQQAKISRDRDGYTRTLQQLATLYVEASRPDQAMKVLKRLDGLQ